MPSIGLALTAPLQRPAAGGGGGTAPANTVPPAVTGTAQQGQTLTASPGSWTGSPAPAFAFQWRRGGADIAGATAAAYTATGADVGAALSVQVTASNAAGSASAVSAATAAVAPSLADLPQTPTARWHPQFSAVTLAAGRVVAASDLMGLAGVTEGAAGIGPRALTDARGRAFWRFEGAEFLAVATTLAGLNNRAVSAFFVGRMHRAGSVNAIFSLGSAGAGTAVNTAGATLDTAVSSSSMPFLRSHSRAGSLDAANAPWLVAGSQLQVMGAVSRTTANGGTRLMIDARAGAVGQNTIAASGVSGGEIGRYAFSPGTSGTWGTFDLYELVVFAAGLTDAQADAVQAALTAHYAVAPVVSQIVLEGDSITQGVAPLASGDNAAMVLAEPGAGRIPAGWRVVSVAASGSQVSNLTTRRDAAGGWGSMLLPGGENVLAMEIGRNDMGSVGNLTAAQHYANVVAFLTAAGTGVLPRGWRVRVLANIATSAAVQPRIEEYRALLRLPAFLADTGSQPGGPYEGRVTVLATDQITDGAAGTVFATAADAGDTVYYDGGQTHLTALGTRLRITGGDTPQAGVGFGL
jgi:hypothetical protein